MYTAHHRTGNDMTDHQQLDLAGSLLLRNPLAFASRTMRRGIRGFCHGVGSTTTQQQLHIDQQRLVAGENDADAASSSTFLTVPSSVVGSCVSTESEVQDGGGARHHAAAPAAVTLEQMILQLDLEEAAEAAARKARSPAVDQAEDCYYPRRMSCVNSSDYVLRSARDALSQYPRFSLDGRDAMYRASFSSYYEGMGLAAAAVPCDGADNAPRYRNSGGRHQRASVCCDAAAEHSKARAPYGVDGYERDLEQASLRTMPGTVAGERVLWRKPGVVAQLMGLEAVPVPVRRSGTAGGRKKGGSGPPLAGNGSGIRKQRIRRMGKEELDKERLFMALHGYHDVDGAGVCHAGARRATVDPSVIGLGREDRDGWEFRFPG